MIKAASQLFCLTLLLAATVPQPLQAQTGASGDVNRAAEEAVRRQADTILLRQKLAAAQTAQQRQDLPKAAKLYEDCYALVQRVGTSVDGEAQAVRIGLAGTLLELAHQSQRTQDYKA